MQNTLKRRENRAVESRRRECSREILVLEVRGAALPVTTMTRHRGRDSAPAPSARARLPRRVLAIRDVVIDSLFYKLRLDERKFAMCTKTKHEVLTWTSRNADESPPRPAPASSKTTAEALEHSRYGYNGSSLAGARRTRHDPGAKAR
ncbi:hypothetical protein EVAR_69542_1 [Eumeta japonica]|uniref:Uncharacterized protein n=1 Tax=Eumeta variegata TaxID=151549 RepID=A0A4C2A1T0_EUMVA|nr:hypothetical protein EVAR_69542_1 [Eumeta japonica]